jgi:hypothetical protein
VDLDYNTLKHLDAFFIAFYDAHAYLNVITSCQLGDRFFFDDDLFLFDFPVVFLLRFGGHTFTSTIF